MPLGLIGYGLMAIAALGLLGGITYKVRQGGYDAAKAECLEAAAAQAKREQELSAFAAKALADERAKKKVVIQTRTLYVDKLVDRPVYRNVCLDADGLRCIESAINGKDAAGCKPDKPMPPSKPPV